MNKEELKQSFQLIYNRLTDIEKDMEEETKYHNRNRFFVIITTLIQFGMLIAILLK